MSKQPENEPLKIERVQCSSLVLDPANARLHPERNLETIRGALKKFGQQKPIVVGTDDVVIAGNGTLEAARILGWSEIDIVRSKLKGSDAVAYAIADNKTGESSKWDYEILQRHVQALDEAGYEMEALAFEPHELENIVAAAWNAPDPKDDDESDDQEGGANSGNAKPIALTVQQREQIERGVLHVQEVNDDMTLTEGRCVELIVAEWLAGQ